MWFWFNQEWLMIAHIWIGSLILLWFAIFKLHPSELVIPYELNRKRPPPPMGSGRSRDPTIRNYAETMKIVDLIIDQAEAATKGGFLFVPKGRLDSTTINRSSG